MAISPQHDARGGSNGVGSFFFFGKPFAFLEFFLYPGGGMPSVKHATARSSESLFMTI